MIALLAIPRGFSLYLSSYNLHKAPVPITVLVLAIVIHQELGTILLLTTEPRLLDVWFHLRYLLDVIPSIGNFVPVEVQQLIKTASLQKPIHALMKC